RFDEAQAALDEALAIGRETGSARVTAAAHERRANLAMLRAKGAPDAAERLRAADYEAVAALEAMGGMQDEERVERVTRLRAQIAERVGDLAAALGFQRDAEAARSRRLENEERARLDVLAARYRSERQAAEIRVLTEKGATQDAELARQRLSRNSLFGSIAAMSVIALLLVARARQRAQSAKLLQEKNAALADALADAHRQRLDAQALAAENAEILRIAAVDLHGPLVDVLGRAERLLTVPGMPPEAQRTAAAVAHSIGNVVHVVRNLTESAELERDVEPLARAPVDLDRLIEDVVARLRPRAAAKRQEIRVAAGAPVRLPAERERLEEALENLLSNAIKFSAPGKPIDIAVAADAEHARISVRDHGAGLTTDDFRRLFGKFQRLSSRPTAGEPSSGLGLALVRQVAERHGGRAYAESDGPGKGSVFVIELPLKQ
ncbi:MAG TPA: ATP-binding protein, partial [Xanthomonadales bacterium]|nr:ATP-binding protein [Xanthomonadales bacterium]